VVKITLKSPFQGHHPLTKGDELMKRAIGVLAAVALLLGGVTSANAGVIPHSDVNGLGTFQDTNTGDVWLKLNDFFGESYNQMKATAEANGFTVADNAGVHVLLDTLPLPDAATWDSYAAVMGKAPNRDLIWGAYLPPPGSTTDSWAFSSRGDSSWSFADNTGFGFDSVPNDPNFPQFEDMNIWAFQSGQSAVPEPGTLTLMGIGIVGIAGYGWRRRKQPLPA
jgi:hypothetical protein